MNRAKRKGHRRRALVILAGLLGVMGVVLLLIPSCGPNIPRMSPEQMARIHRAVTAPPEGVPPVSYLHGGDETLPRVIYIHGTPGSASGWNSYVADPVPGTESVAVDRLGFGQSKVKGGTEPSFVAQADSIVPLLVERDGKWPILVGHSIGGPIAAEVAARYPGKVGGLVIVAGSFDPVYETPGTVQSVASTGFVRFFLPGALDHSMGELKAAKRETTLLAEELAKVTCPVIVVHGTKDALVDYGNVEYIRKMFTAAKSMKVVTLEGKGHFVIWEEEGVVRKVVGEMVKGMGK